MSATSRWQARTRARLEEPGRDPLARLLDACAGYRSAVVGFSAGVDSTVVLWALTRILGAARVLAVTACSPTFPERELREAHELAVRIGAPLRVVDSDEMANPAFRNNPTNRCYLCKTELYGKLREVALAAGFAEVADGTNLDDEGDYRPGLVAAAEHQVRSPLREARIAKAEVRAIARAAGLPNADKPAFACLSSRIPYGEVITVEKLSQVGAAEDALRALGFGQLRVRHHGDVGRIEVPPADFGRAVELAPRIVAALREAGYRHVALDLGGYRSGSLNPALPPEAGA
jgi:pyridinium-3,5-biscarboxylic acid mononucleotide sulfurtransferase